MLELCLNPRLSQTESLRSPQLSPRCLSVSGVIDMELQCQGSFAHPCVSEISFEGMKDSPLFLTVLLKNIQSTLWPQAAWSLRIFELSHSV